MVLTRLLGPRISQFRHFCFCLNDVRCFSIYVFPDLKKSDHKLAIGGTCVLPKTGRLAPTKPYIRHARRLHGRAQPAIPGAAQPNAETRAGATARQPGTPGRPHSLGRNCQPMTLSLSATSALVGQQRRPPPQPPRAGGAIAPASPSQIACRNAGLARAWNA